MNYLRLVPGVHVPIRTPGARHLRRVLGDPNIFTYAHRQKGTIVIASWLNRSGQIAIEHAIVTTDADWPTAIQAVIWQRSPASHRDVKAEAEAIRHAGEPGTEEAQESANEHASMVEFLRRRASIHKQDHPDWVTL